MNVGNFDLSQSDRIRLKRSLSDTNIAAVLEDPNVHKGIAQLRIYRNPLRANMPRQGPQSAGQNAAIVVRRATGSSTQAFYADTDAIGESTGTYTQASFVYRTMATRMKITRLAQLIGRSYVDVFAAEMSAKVADFNDFEEKELIASATADDSDSFDGINALLPSAQVVKVTTAIAGSALTEAKIREAIDLAKGTSYVYQDSDGRPSSAILTSEGGGREFDALIASRQNLNDAVMNVAGGFRLRKYDDMPIIRTNVIGSAMTGVAAKHSRTELLGATGATTVAYFLNFSELWVEELEPFHVVPLATTDSQFDQADLRQTITVVFRDTTAMSALINFSV